MKYYRSICPLAPLRLSCGMDTPCAVQPPVTRQRSHAATNRLTEIRPALRRICATS